MTKIVLKGYYGKGNLGDDVLMITTLRIAKEIFPDSEVMICSDSDQAAYIKNLVGDIALVKSNNPIEADYIIHGGGGVYFDFKKGNWKFTLLNSFIRLISFDLYRKIYKTVQGWRSNLGITATSRLGLGIGVGTYTPSSRKFYADILSLSNYDYLIVRDQESAAHVTKLGLKYPVAVATDLAFMRGGWMPERLAGNKSGKCIGIILRDWPLNRHAHVDDLFEVAVALETQGYELIFFSLDQNEDHYYLKKFARSKFITWNPFELTLREFLSHVSKADVVISSRAHGCIIAACLGIPSVCLGIEPKLEKISQMLKKSSTYLPQPSTKENLLKAIEVVLGSLEQKKEAIVEDLKLNNEILEREIGKLRQFINQSKLQ